MTPLRRGIAAAAGASLIALVVGGSAVAGSTHDDAGALSSIASAQSQLASASAALDDAAADITAPPPTVTATATITAPPVTTTVTATTTVTTTAQAASSFTAGMFNNMPSGDTTANWLTTRPALGGSALKIARRFNSGLPSSCPDAAWARANGVTLAYSVKADPVTMASGSLDATVASLARSMDAGWFLIYYHEPEDNMDGPTFKAAFTDFYKAAKAANPQLRVIYAAMEYQYGHGKNFTDYDPYPYVDGYGLDVYDMDWEALTDLSNTTFWPGLTKWLAGVRTHNLPYGFTEWGVEKTSTRPDQTVADYLTRNLAWLKAQGASFALYWNGDAMSDGDYAISNRPLSAAAWKAAE